jgi:hypothetical protein
MPMMFSKAWGGKYKKGKKENSLGLTFEIANKRYQPS